MPITTCVFDAYGTLVRRDRRRAAGGGRAGFRRDRATTGRSWPNIGGSSSCSIPGCAPSPGRMTISGRSRRTGWTGRWRRPAITATPPCASGCWRSTGNLQAYPEVPDMLAALKDGGLNTAILSNGSPAMLDGAVNSAGIGDVLDACLSVESVGIFKPDASVYDLVGQHFGCTNDERAVRLLQRLGRGGGDRLRLYHRLGQPQRRSDGPPALDTRTTCCNDLTGIPALAGRLMAAFHHLRRADRCITPTRAQGLPILCLAGLTRTGADFDYVAPHLAGHRLITHGLSRARAVRFRPGLAAITPCPWNAATCWNCWSIWGWTRSRSSAPRAAG